MVDDGFLIGFEDSNGNFVEVGRFNNTADDVTQPLEIKHQNSGERITLDSSGFETSGDIRPGRNLILDQTVADTPNSVIHQYRGQNVTNSIWADSVSDADMLMNGPQNTILDGSDSAQGASSDGVDDFAVASRSTSTQSNPADLPEKKTFGIALTFQTTDASDLTSYFATLSATNSRFSLSDTDFFSGETGNLVFTVQDTDGNSFDVETDPSISFADGNVHICVINKNGNSASDINIYVDDLTTPVSTTIQRAQGFDPTRYDNPGELVFFARDNQGTIERFKQFSAGLFEFSTEPYSQIERNNLKSRRPEV
jgi:hypothetical protein